METKQIRFQSPCKDHFSRRAFILKGSQLAAGITLNPEILSVSASNFSFQKRTKEEIYKQLNELVYKNFQVYGTCSQATFSTFNQVFRCQVTKPKDYGILAQEGALNNCPEVVKKAVHISADIILEKV